MHCDTFKEDTPQSNGSTGIYDEHGRLVSYFYTIKAGLLDDSIVNYTSVRRTSCIEYLTCPSMSNTAPGYSECM